MILILTVSLFAAAVAAPYDKDELWATYKQRYNKQYGGDIELARKIIFKQNVETITSHNMEADLGKHSYWMGINQFTDMSNEEFRQRMNGFKNTKSSNGSTFLVPENLRDLPSHVDWRKKGYVTPVKNQGQCGSCWAFSTTGSLEGQHFRKTGRLVSLSEQNLVDCSGPEGNEGCNGGLMTAAFTYIKKNHGIDTEKCYPYEASDDDCRFKRSCVGATVTGFVKIPHGDEIALQKAAATIGPVSVAIDAGHMSFQMYSHGVYNEPDCSSTSLDHGVLVVGYGSDSGSGSDYWLVKNSWGADWGMKGYIWMSRNEQNQCGIASMACYPLV